MDPSGKVNLDRLDADSLRTVVTDFLRIHAWNLSRPSRLNAAGKRLEIYLNNLLPLLSGSRLPPAHNTALPKIPKIDQAMLILFREPGLTDREIAKRVRCSPSLLSRSKTYQRLRKNCLDLGRMPLRGTKHLGRVDAVDRDDDE